jgi:nucleotide-binding universal stress UspA family protein
MPAPTMMVRLSPGKSNDRILRLAVDVAGRLGAAKAIGIAACQPLQYFLGPDAYVPQHLIDQDSEQIAKELKSAERGFRAAFEGKNITLDWRSIVTLEPLARYVARQMRAADLLITESSKADLFDNQRHIAVADVVMAAGRPVLIAGEKVDRLDLRQAMVAWKDTREARHAIVAALPLLSLAKNVTLVEVTRKDELGQATSRLEDVASWLKMHNIAATPRAIAAQGDDSTRLETFAKDIDAGLVVAGAYGHNRLSEWALGGVTRDFLLRPAGCVLVCH